MKIESSDQTIEDLLKSGYYVIPRFQRPYSWDAENITEFWDDIVRDKPSEYFIGSMVVYKTGNRTFGVVDGQQRLTTITILLCVLRDALQTEGISSLSDGLHQLIENKNIDNESEFVLQTETSFPYFQDQIQSKDDAELEPEIRREEKNLAFAHNRFQKLVSETISAIKSDQTKTEDEVESDIKKSLSQIRDALLGLSVILVKLDNEDDAYIIFETLNTRGKDLSLADLVKNHFTRLLKKKNKGIDTTKEKWQKVRETIEGSKVEISTDTFLHHYWMSRYEYITAKALFKTFKKSITKPRAASELSQLEKDSYIYRSIHEISYRGWTKQEKAISDSLSALMLFRVRQQVPCVLSLVRSYDSGIIKKKSIEKSLEAIEKFHFQFTAITSQRSSGGISGMYASLGRRIYEAQTSQQAGDVINELIGKLRDRVPSENEFVALFPELVYTKQLSKQRGLVRYVLLQFARHDNLALPGDFDDLTIEHLLPQDKIDDDEFANELVGQLGNLILVSPELNEKLKNKSFSDKKNILINEGYPLPEAIADAPEWNSEAIEQRTEELAIRAHREIWRI